MREVTSASVVVRARPAVVWALLAGLEAYPAWTRAVRISGEGRLGAELDYQVTGQTRGGKVRTVHFLGPVTRWEEGRVAAWRAGVPVLLDIYFTLTLEAPGPVTRVWHSVQVDGVFAGWTARLLARVLSPPVQQFLADLEARVGRRAWTRAGSRRGRR